MLINSSGRRKSQAQSQSVLLLLSAVTVFVMAAFPLRACVRNKLVCRDCHTCHPTECLQLIHQLADSALGHSSFVSLPQLRSSLTELDLSGSKVGDLTRLATLINLQKLTLPATPSPAGLQCLKQTPRLKHVAIVKREGGS